MQYVCHCRHGKKTTFLHEQGLSQNYFTQNRCVNYNKSEFAIKQRNMYLTTTMSKIGLQHNYTGNLYVIHNFFPPIFKVKVKKIYLIKSHKNPRNKRKIAT